MNIHEYVKTFAKEKGRTLSWVADALEMNYKTFIGKLSRNTLTAEELLKISVILDVNLEFMKYEADFDVKSNCKFIYVVENISDEEVLNNEIIVATSMELREESYKGNLNYDTVYTFDELSDEDSSATYEIKKISAKNLIKHDGNTSVPMIRTAPGSNLFTKGKKRLSGSSIRTTFISPILKRCE